MRHHARAQWLLLAVMLALWGGTAVGDEPSRPAAVPRTTAEARGQARLLHEAMHATLHFVHRAYYREDEGLPIPAATLDKVGPLTRSIADAALVLDALHGPDGRDETVPDLPFTWDGRADVKGLRIGYVESELASAGDADERQQSAARRSVYEAAMATYRAAGATLVPITLPDLPAAAIYTILNAEAGAMFDELLRSGAINELADKGVNGRANQLRATRFIPAVEYIRAQRVRTLLLQRMNAVFESVDLFLSPSQSDSVTMTNLTGHPAVVLPAGFVDGLPVAIMLTGRLWEESTVLRAAAAFEAATDWHTKHPAL